MNSLSVQVVDIVIIVFFGYAGIDLVSQSQPMM
jgi:hypothetical protein